VWQLPQPRLTCWQKNKNHGILNLGASSLSDLTPATAYFGRREAVCCMEATPFSQKAQLSYPFPLLWAQYGHAL
jgi:hypothetical protein